MRRHDTEGITDVQVATAGHEFTPIQHAAAELIAAGYAVCRVSAKTKRAYVEGWSTRTEHPAQFTPTDLIGVMGGPLSNGGHEGHALVIVDLDSADAVKLANDWLPATTMMEGRKGKPNSHRYYLVPLESIPPEFRAMGGDGAEACHRMFSHTGPRTKSYKGKDKQELIRRIGTGGMTVCPPSTWHSKDGTQTEPREWFGGSRVEPAIIQFSELRDAVELLALACGCTQQETTTPQSYGDVNAAVKRGEVTPAVIERAKSYLEACPPAVLGSDGSGTMFGVARSIVYGFNFPREIAYELIVENYNGRCVPPWSEDELRHKLEDADTLPYGKPRGFLLTDSTAVEIQGIVITAAEAGQPGKYLLTASRGGQTLHRDTVSLDSAISRDRFLKATIGAAELNGDADTVLKELNAELLRLAENPPRSITPAEQPVIDPRIGPLDKMPDAVKQLARELLSAPDILDRIAVDIESAGVAGERDLGLLVYLTGISSQLPKPLACIVRGATTSGKSHIVERVATLFPPEVTLLATSLTTNALYYFPPGTLRHRWVIAGERSRLENDDSAEATRALREMISSGKLTRACPMKDGDTITTKIIEQDGPIAYTETTSMGELFEEDANRCLLLNTNETPEQTRLILAATAAKAAGVGGVDTDAIRRVHHALVRMLPRVEVIVPYAAAIATHYPVERVESRRSFTHLLKLIQASALLHHLQRARDDHGRVIAADQDYAVAERLARAPLTVAAGGLTASSREYLKALRERFADQNFTQADAQTVGNVSPATRKRRLVELVAQGEVVITLPQSGSRAGQYMVVSRPSSRFPAPDVIPSLARVVSDPSEIGEPLSQ